MRDNRPTKIRSAVILTTGYVVSDVIKKVEEYNELVLYHYFTKGSLTSLNIKVESSIDGVNYVQETNMSISGADITLNKAVYNTTETGNFKIAIPISANYVRVSYQGVGTVTSSSLESHAYLHEV